MPVWHFACSLFKDNIASLVASALALPISRKMIMAAANEKIE
jgi:hypothetical protein